MSIKRLSIGTLVGAIVLYALGYLIFELLAADFYAENMGAASGVIREEPLIWATVIGTVGYALLVTLAIGARAGSASIADGLKIGAAVGFLVWLTADFILLGAWDVSSVTLAVVDPLIEAVRAGIGGAAVAAVLAKV